MVPDADRDGSGPLFRGWQPSRGVRAGVFLGLGAVLLLHPLVGGLPNALGLTGTVQYTAVEVSSESNRLSFAGPERAEFRAESMLGGESGLSIDCYPLDSSKRCVFESQLTTGNLTVTTEPQGWGGYTYHDRFYAEVSGHSNDSDTVELGLRPVSARAVLANISVSPDVQSDSIRTAIETGNVSTDERLPFTGAVLAHDDSYYVVVPVSGENNDQTPGRVTAMISTVLGVLALHRGKDEYTHWQTAE